MIQVDAAPINAAGAFQSRFAAQHILINNPTGAVLLVRIGSQDIPTASNADYAVLPYTVYSVPIKPATMFAFAFLQAQLPLNPMGLRANVTWFDTPQTLQVTNQSLPGVGYTAAYLFYSNGVNAAGGSYQIFGFSAGQRPQIYLIIVSVLTLPGVSKFVFQDTTPANFASVVLTSTVLTQQISFFPNGIQLPVNSGLAFFTSQTTLTNVEISVVYNFV